MEKNRRFFTLTSTKKSMSPTKWLILWLISSYFIFGRCAVVSIELYVAAILESQSNATTSITLYWNNEKILCEFLPSQFNKWYNCTASRFLYHQSNCNISQQTMIISHPLSLTNGLWIDQIEIYDDTNNTFYYDTFCSNLAFPYSQTNNETCNSYPMLQSWDVLCTGLNCTDYQSIQIDLSHPESHELGEASVTQYQPESVQPDGCPTNQSTSGTFITWSNLYIPHSDSVFYQLFLVRKSKCKSLWFIYITFVNLLYMNKQYKHILRNSISN